MKWTGTKLETSFWTSSDGRTSPVRDLDLSHLLNIVHDCNFRVASMRRAALGALGSTNRNLNTATVDAFHSVRPVDVFPAWPAIVEQTKLKFRAKFGMKLADVRNRVYGAWEHGGWLPGKYSDAVRFCLQPERRSVPPRLVPYMASFTVVTAEAFRTMCWNLRIDQPQAASLIRTGPAPFAKRVIAPSPCSSALMFDQPRQRAFDSLKLEKQGRLDMLDEWEEFN
jgi:hypothetical protein